MLEGPRRQAQRSSGKDIGSHRHTRYSTAKDTNPVRASGDVQSTPARKSAHSPQHHSHVRHSTSPQHRRKRSIGPATAHDQGYLDPDALHTIRINDQRKADLYSTRQKNSEEGFREYDGRHTGHAITRASQPSRTVQHRNPSFLSQRWSMQGNLDTPADADDCIARSRSSKVSSIGQFARAVRGRDIDLSGAECEEH